MRKILALLLAGLFLILFFIAVTVNQAIDTASDPDVITGMIDDADLYDYAYDNILANLVHDMVEKGIEVNTGLDDSSPPTVLKFEDTEAAAIAITNLIETLVPREYVKEKLEASLSSAVPYASGETDEFEIDLEVQERVRAVPGAVRQLVSDIDLTERIIADLLVPQFDSFTDDISGQALGIKFTSTEVETATRQLFEPVWLEGQLFTAIDEITPYFAGDSSSFNVVLRFDDRVTVIGTILKDKLSDEDTLYNLVFSQVIDPLIEQTVAQSNSVGFGIELTETEVVSTFAAIAPRNWVQEQAEGVIDALIAYLVGATDSLGYTVDLTDRKTTAVTELQLLAKTKLESTLSGIPECATPQELLGASQDIQAQQLPRCIAGEQTTIDVALATFLPVMNAQVESFVSGQVPNEVAYTQADLEAQLGGTFDTVIDVRSRIADGVSFSDEDLVELMAGDSSSASRADAREALKILADGVAFTEENITKNLTPLARQQFDDIRGYVNTGLSLRWLLWVLVLIPLVIIALVGGEGWAGRFKWAGGVAVVSALIIYGGIAVAWSFNDIAQEYVPDYGADVSAEFKADYPRLGTEIESGELDVRFERALDSWQGDWRNQTVPWIIIGALVFGLGHVWPKLTEKKGVRMGTGPTYEGSSPTPSSSGTGGLSITKDWGDDPNAPDAEGTHATSADSTDDKNTDKSST
jgi:hypothetical protein